MFSSELSSLRGVLYLALYFLTKGETLGKSFGHFSGVLFSLFYDEKFFLLLEGV